MFVILLNYTKPLDEVDRFRDGHMAYLRRHYETGRFVISGRREPRTGGVIVARGHDIEELRRVVQEDPFVTEGVADVEIVEFVVGNVAPGLEPLAE